MLNVRGKESCRERVRGRGCRGGEQAAEWSGVKVFATVAVVDMYKPEQGKGGVFEMNGRRGRMQTGRVLMDEERALMGRARGVTRPSQSLALSEGSYFMIFIFAKWS